MLRFHTQTAGVSLTAQQPEINIVRTAIEALAGVLGGTQSLHTNSMDEAMALPTQKAARIALRTQQIIAHETNVAHVADPLGGSWFVEELTDTMEGLAEEIFAHLDDIGDGSMLEGLHPWHRGQLVPGPHRRLGLRAGTGAERRSADHRRRQRLHRGQRGRRDRAVADHPRGRSPPAQAPRADPPRPQRRRRARPPSAASPSRPPIQRSI